MLGYLASPLRAQKNDSLLCVEKSQRIFTLYNQKKYSDIYKLCSSSFRQQVSADYLNSVLNDLLWENYGAMTAVQPMGFAKGAWNFDVAFQQGDIRMRLMADAKGQLRLFEFTTEATPEPPTETPPTLAGPVSGLPKSDNPLQTALDSVVHAAAKGFIYSSENCGLSIGVLYNGQRYYYNYGEVRRGSAQLPDKNTLYEIGSVTKTFCGLLLAAAVSEKKIALDDDIRMYLPGKYPNLPEGKEAIRIRHLANHTSGLPRVPENLNAVPGYDSLNPYHSYSEELLLGYLKTLHSGTPPGTTCNYSNYGMALLGYIVSRVYQQPFAELVEQKITTPALLKSTAVQLSPAQRIRLAQGYNNKGEETPHWDLNAFVAAGGLHADTDDLLSYLAYNRAEAHPALRLAHQVTFSERQKVGLAWFLSSTKAGNTLVWHNGATFGFSSFCGYVQEKDMAISILANSSTPVDPLAIAVLNYLQSR